jgi:hypothetical protein
MEVTGWEGNSGDARTRTETAMHHLHMPSAHLAGAGCSCRARSAMTRINPP